MKLPSVPNRGLNPNYLRYQTSKPGRRATRVNQASGSHSHIFEANKKTGFSPGLFDTLKNNRNYLNHSMRRRRHTPNQPHTVWSTALCIFNTSLPYLIHCPLPVTSTGDTVVSKSQTPNSKPQIPTKSQTPNPG